MWRSRSSQVTVFEGPFRLVDEVPQLLACSPEDRQQAPHAATINADNYLSARAKSGTPDQHNCLKPRTARSSGLLPTASAEASRLILVLVSTLTLIDTVSLNTGVDER